MNKSVVFLLCTTVIFAVAGVVLFVRQAPPSPRVSTPAEPHQHAVAPAKMPHPSLNMVALSSPFQPLPLDAEFDQRKVALGHRLFHEQRLSSDGSISCASCHAVERGGVDGQRVSLGVGGKPGKVNAPTVLNSGFNFRQNWDGRSETLETEVDGPLLGSMASNWDAVLGMLNADSAYTKEFSAVYTDKVTAANVRDAIATYERSLITPNARFDRYLRGDTNALTAQEREGYRLFTDFGCVACHQGINIGGNMFEVLGRMGNYFEDRGNVQPADLGRFNVTKDERDRYKFKVPSLRNIELTAPYLHDGSAATLEEAIKVMARYQIGQPLHDDEVTSLVAFLRTLTGESPKHL